MEKTKPHILLVEDDLNLGFVIKDKLKEAGYQVSWATNGKDGLQKCLDENYDLAVLDVMLPQMGGFELAEEIVEIKPEMPFMFLTAKNLIDDKVKGLKLGRDYLTKPFDFQELLARLQNLISPGEDPSASKDLQVFKLGRFRFDYVNQYLEEEKETHRLTK